MRRYWWVALIPVVAIAAVYARLHFEMSHDGGETVVDTTRNVDPGDIDVAIALDYDAIQLVTANAIAVSKGRLPTAEERTTDAARRFLTLSPDEQHRLRARFNDIRALTPDKKAELVTKYETYCRLSADERESLRAASRNSARQW